MLHFLIPENLKSYYIEYSMIFQFNRYYFLPNWKKTLYSPKESSLELTNVGPLGLNGFLYIVLLFRIFHPYVSWSLFGGWWAYFWVKNWLFQSCFKIVWALFLDLKCPCLGVVSAQKYFWWPSKVWFFDKILASVSLSFWPVLTIFGVEKIIFWTLSRLFCSCLEMV